MSGTAAVGTTFASAVTATGLQLDNNFSTVVAYLNDPTNRNNYAADAGTTNTVVTTFAPPVTGGYTAGLELTWKWAATNSGGVVLNANGLGNISLVNPGGGSLDAGQGVVGSIGKAVYDGTRAIYLTPSSPASAGQMATATAVGVFAAPANIKYSPGVAKAMAMFNGTNTGVITALSSVNVTSITRTGTGTYSITFTNNFANTNYPVLAETQAESLEARAIGRTAGGMTVVVRTPAGASSDATEVQFVAYGVLA